LFQAEGLSITGRPDVMAVNPACNPDATGVMVVFGTGVHSGYGSDQTRPNAIFGIWDKGVPVGVENYIVSQRHSTGGHLFSGRQPQLLRIVHSVESGSAMHSITPGNFRDNRDRSIGWSKDGLAKGAASRANNEQIGHVAGWSVGLTSASLATNPSEERITGTVAIRGGRAVVTSYIPGAFPGPAHGSGSRIFVLDACTGRPICDADGTNDYPIAFSKGLSSNPVILKNPSQPHIDHFLAWDSEGRIIQTAFSGERQGKVYWRQNF
jgi:Tfp pilus tip-associated adhesin PilY1